MRACEGGRECIGVRVCSFIEATYQVVHDFMLVHIDHAFSLHMHSPDTHFSGMATFKFALRAPAAAENAMIRALHCDAMAQIVSRRPRLDPLSTQPLQRDPSLSASDWLTLAPP